MEQSGKGPLEGLLVLDTASYVAGPAAATIMADYGADVIKVEPPQGDPMRAFDKLPGMPVSDDPYPWIFQSRGKRSIVLDLENPTDWQALAGLVKRADVFITNAPSRVAQKLNIRKEDICPLNDQLIYARISGYGEEGPDADKPGFDVNAYWARSGLQDLVRDPDGPPSTPMPAMGDLPTAVCLFSAVMLALYDRQRNGYASPVHTSLLANGLWSNGIMAQAVLSGAEFSPDRRGNRNRRFALAGDVQSSDGRWIKLTMIKRGEEEWRRFAQAIEREDLLDDPRFLNHENRVQNTPALIDILDAVFAQQDFETWKERLTAHHVPHGPVVSVRDLHEDKQPHVAGVIAKLDRPVGSTQETIAVPMRFEKSPPRPGNHVPSLDEHGDEICAQFGLTRSGGGDKK